MPVSFLDLLPKPPTASVKIATAEGEHDVELSGISLRNLADISKRYPAFARVLDGGFGSIMDNPDALAAVIAASLGHSGEKDYEAHVLRFPSRDVLRMALAIVQLTFPPAVADPLPAAGNGVDAAASAPSLPLQLSN